MITPKRFFNNALTLTILWAFLIGNLLIVGQDLGGSEDLSLGASVFVFRSSKTAQKRFVAANKAKSNKAQRVVAAKRIRKQYETLAVVTNRRKNIKSVAPTTVAVAAGSKVKVKTPKQASLDFTAGAQYLYEQNKYDEAIELYREAIDADEKNQDAKLGLSDALAAKGSDLMETDKTQEARGLFVEAIGLNDKNSVAYAGMGEIFDVADQNAKAIENYEKALALDAKLTGLYAPLGILYYQKNEIPKAEDFLSKALAAENDDALTNYFLGVIRLNEKRYEDARVALEKSKGMDAKMPEVRVSLGEALDKLDREDEAVHEFNEALKLRQDYFEALFNLGVINYERGNYTEAVNYYTKAAKIKNDSGEAHANLADSYRQLQKYNEANGSYNLAAIFLKKKDAELYSNWGFCLGKVMKWDTAIVRLNEAIALSADHIDYTNLGWAYYNSAQIDLKSKRPGEAKTKLQQAKTALQQALALKRDFAPANLNLGITLIDLGEYQAAVEVLKRATDARKNWLFAINELGIAYRKLNDYPNAIKQFERAVELNDKYTIGVYNLGEAQFRGGKVKEARKTHEKLKKLDRNLANVLEILIVGAKY